MLGQAGRQTHARTRTQVFAKREMIKLLRESLQVHQLNSRELQLAKEKQEAMAEMVQRQQDMLNAKRMRRRWEGPNF